MHTPEKKESGELEQILAAIERPLAFASKKNFTGLANIKGFDKLIPSLAARGFALTQDPNCRTCFKKIQAGFHGFYEMTADHQKQVILEALDSLEKIRSLNQTKSDGPAPALAPEQYFRAMQTSLLEIKGIGPKIYESFLRKNIKTVEDILYLLPRAYIDRRRIQKISEMQPGMYATATGKVLSTGKALAAGRKKIFELIIHDGSGSLRAKWFNINTSYLNFIKKKFDVDRTVILSGLVTDFRFQKEMHHPEIELLSEDDDLGAKLTIIPVYPLTEGIQQKTLQKIMKQVVESYAPLVPEIVPAAVKSEKKLVSIQSAFKHVHFPAGSDSFEDLVNFRTAYHYRIVFDEFFLLQTVLALKKRGVSIEKGIKFTIPSDKLDGFFASLPFSLTNAQNKTLENIFCDMQKPIPMNRLIQGDVGSGKTVVGLIAALVSIWNGYQGVFMAPTEILAEQHYKTVKSLTAGLDISMLLLTGSLTKSQKQTALSTIRDGKAQLIIGTHALIQEGVEFFKLGIAIVDEQHKFGVLQRAEIKKKGANPDILVMTATPIPRTLGLTVYGDLDISIINELPPGRRPVVTKVFHENRRQSVYDIVSAELNKKNQVFIVYPLVEESEKLDLKDASRMAAHLQQEVFSEHRVGLVHGKMPANEKAAVMQNFLSGRIHILVATTVVEVGIDVPNASLMIIEHAERFGLSQLHQLRGRVGRGAADSTCILLAQYNKSDDARQRLAIMEKTNDGFIIAEKDFDIRGPGEFLGTRQSGIPDFRVAHIGRDISILIEARKAAFDLIAKDPQLQLPANRLLKKVLVERWKGRLELAGIG